MPAFRLSTFVKWSLTVALLLLILVTPTHQVQAATSWTEDFETDGLGTRYTVTNSFRSSNNDHYQRTDGSDISNVTGAYSAFGGSSYWAGEDQDGAGSDGLDEKTIEFQDLQLDGCTGPRFSGKFGAGSTAGDYDSTDYMIVEYSTNGGASYAATPLLSFQYDNANNDSFNEDLALDSDNDGIGEGTKLTPALQTFTVDMSALVSTSGTVRFRIVTHSDSGDEEMAFDDISFECTTAITLVSFDVNANLDGTVDVDWETSAEINHAGFNLYRKDADRSDWDLLNEQLIASRGTDSGSASYQFSDSTVLPGTWLYMLEDVDNNGITTRHPAVEVTVSSPTAVALATSDVQMNSLVMTIAGLFVIAASLSLVVILQQRRKNTRELQAYQPPMQAPTLSNKSMSNKYVRPAITRFTEDDIRRAIGPALAGGSVDPLGDDELFGDS